MCVCVCVCYAASSVNVNVRCKPPTPFPAVVVVPSVSSSFACLSSCVCVCVCCSVVDPVRRLKFSPMAKSSSVMARAAAKNNAAKSRKNRWVGIHSKHRYSSLERRRGRDEPAARPSETQRKVKLEADLACSHERCVAKKRQSYTQKSREPHGRFQSKSYFPPIYNSSSRPFFLL